MRIIFSLFILFLTLPATMGAQEERQQAFYYCADHPNKVFYFSTGKAVAKKNLKNSEFYQYGFMKRMGWINRSWEGLEYEIRFLPNKSQLAKQLADSLRQSYAAKGYEVKEVSMPYPMKPYLGYKKDGTN